MENGHGLSRAVAARGRRAAGERQAEGHGVEENVGWVGDVGDGAGEAVVLRRRVLQARGRVQNLVGAKPVESLGDRNLVGVILLLAVGAVDEILGGLGEELFALVDVGSAGRVEYADDADKLLLGLEERGRRL